MDRIESGIPGLDEMTQGGFPLPSAILVAGEPGTGKTTFALQSLFYGAERGDVGLYFTVISEPADIIQKFLREFNFYSQEMIETEKLVFVDLSDCANKEPSAVIETIMENVKKYNAKRVIIDPITSIGNSLGEPYYRKFIYGLIPMMKSHDCVIIMTAESSYADITRSVNAYLADAVILLSYKEIENSRKKYLEVLKMRGTNHLTGRRSLIISKDGLMVQPELG